MKNKLFSTIALAGLLTLGVTSQIRPAKAEQQRQHRSEAVIAWAVQASYNVTEGDGGSHLVYDGAKIYAASSSSGAPVFPQYPSTNLIELAEAEAQLLSAGYTVKISDNGLILHAIKQ